MVAIREGSRCILLHRFLVLLQKKKSRNGLYLLRDSFCFVSTMGRVLDVSWCVVGHHLVYNLCDHLFQLFDKLLGIVAA